MLRHVFIFEVVDGEEVTEAFPTLAAGWAYARRLGLKVVEVKTYLK